MEPKMNPNEVVNDILSGMLDAQEKGVRAKISNEEAMRLGVVSVTVGASIETDDGAFQMFRPISFDGSSN